MHEDGETLSLFRSTLDKYEELVRAIRDLEKLVTRHATLLEERQTAASRALQEADRLRSSLAQMEREFAVQKGKGIAYGAVGGILGAAAAAAVMKVLFGGI